MMWELLTATHRRTCGSSVLWDELFPPPLSRVNSHCSRYSQYQMISHSCSPHPGERIIHFLPLNPWLRAHTHLAQVLPLKPTCIETTHCFPLWTLFSIEILIKTIHTHVKYHHQELEMLTSFIERKGAVSRDNDTTATKMHLANHSWPLKKAEAASKPSSFTL